MVGHAVTQNVLEQKRIHIILEYCEGGDLNQLANKEPHKMTEKYVLHLAEQIAKGIRYLHTRDPVIVYGDLKGTNILFKDTAFMQVKIADLDSFGMFRGSQTVHGFMKNPAGSPTHMSPEMLTICDKLNSLSNMDERVGRRTDMYSFACLILELINKGQVPYTNPNKLSIAQEELSSLQAIRNVINEGGCPDVSILFSAPNALRYSRELQALLNQCLHWDPAERPDCHDLLARISYLRTGFFRSPHVLGIDFGESKISAAIYDGKVFRTIRNSIGGNNLAACVFFLEKDDSLTGLDAIRHADLWPSGYASRFKSCLLLDNPREFNKFIREKEPHYSTENSPAFTLTAMDGTKIVKRPAELLILLFKKIRRLAKDFLGPEPSCIVTYPDTWNAESRNKIAECLRVAGFEKCSFITDFKAILLGYYMKTMPSTTVDVNIIVDVGYEDCRVSLHTVSRGEDTFSTTKAKLPYGGRAIDMGLLKFCGDDFMRTNKFDFRDNPEAVLRVLLACEAAKIQLSTSEPVTVSVKQVLRGKDLECVVSVEDFRKICGPIAAKIIDAIRLRAKEYEKGKYALLLVGGGSRVPIIRELINFIFEEHVNTSVQFYADEAALLGAAGRAAAVARSISESSVRVLAEVLRTATKRAGVLAGLEVLRIINEPTAAALAYGLHRIGSETLMVVDFGGGTLDVSILKITDGQSFQVLTTSGDMRFGGDDFDERILQHFRTEFETTHKVSLKDHAEALSKLRMEAEWARLAIARGSDKYRVWVPYLDGRRNFHSGITAVQFNTICEDLFARVAGPVREALLQCEMQPGEISKIVMVGGSSRLPQVEHILREIFPDQVIHRDINPDGKAGTKLSVDTPGGENMFYSQDDTDVKQNIERKSHTLLHCNDEEMRQLFFKEKPVILKEFRSNTRHETAVDRAEISAPQKKLSRHRSEQDYRNTSESSGVPSNLRMPGLANEQQGSHLNPVMDANLGNSNQAAGLVRNQHDQLGDRNQVNEHSNYSDDEKNDRIVDFVQTCNRDNSDSNYMCSSENLATPSTEEDKSGSTSSFNTPVGESGFHSHDDTDGKQNVKKEFHTRRDVDVEIPPLEEKDRSKTRQEGDEFPDTLVDRAEISPSQKKPSHRTSEQYCRKISEGSCVSSNLTSQHRGGSGREETSSACSGKRDHYTKQQFAMTGNDLATDSFRTPGDPLEDHNKANEHCHYSGDEKNRRHQEPNKMISQTSSNHMHSLENLTTQSTEKDKAGTISSFNTPGGENVFHSQDNRSGKQNVEMESHTRQDMDVVMSPVEKKDYNKTRREGDGFSNTTVDRVEKPSRPTSEQDYRNESEGSCVPPNLMIPGLGSEQQGSHPNPSVHDSVDDDDQVTASYEHGVPQAQKPKTWWGTLKSFYG
ncbi:putative Chaperone protein dnaK [Hypsibius exemplaris]|uniref:Chaperone protein dnaK n=1 Tax=Hypsibius exemplaris TaxID=2072580 RepID=A0A9X6RP82_HYPEX|nr:putative Chaperone protein dnaK [Hypsibius exemplaris]